MAGSPRKGYGMIILYLLLLGPMSIDYCPGDMCMSKLKLI